MSAAFRISRYNNRVPDPVCDEIEKRLSGSSCLTLAHQDGPTDSRNDRDGHDDHEAEIVTSRASRPS